MDTTRIEALTGMLTVLGILVLLILPSVAGILHDRRVDRQIREAERARAEAGARRPARRPGYLTTTVTHHS
ncbi:hypothetical protein ABT301_17190 [Streptomyces sp. NPDC000987]|uniref:hypothetical protein n=1 Tax=Streptomyces sp. NPDC000987 TaxID=3154374 RepID=UPI00332C36C7